MPRGRFRQPLPDRMCEGCGQPLVRYPWDAPSKWRRKRYHDTACFHLTDQGQAARSRARAKAYEVQGANADARWRDEACRLRLLGYSMPLIAECLGRNVGNVHRCLTTKGVERPAHLHVTRLHRIKLVGDGQPPAPPL